MFSVALVTHMVRFDISCVSSSLDKIVSFLYCLHANGKAKLLNGIHFNRTAFTLILFFFLKLFFKLRPRCFPFYFLLFAHSSLPSDRSRRDSEFVSRLRNGLLWHLYTDREENSGHG